MRCRPPRRRCGCSSPRTTRGPSSCSRPRSTTHERAAHRAPPVASRKARLAALDAPRVQLLRSGPPRLRGSVVPVPPLVVVVPAAVDPVLLAHAVTGVHLDHLHHARMAAVVVEVGGALIER